MSALCAPVKGRGGRGHAYVEAGVTAPVLSAVSFGREQAEATLWAVAEAYDRRR